MSVGKSRHYCDWPYLIIIAVDNIFDAHSEAQLSSTIQSLPALQRLNVACLFNDDDDDVDDYDEEKKKVIKMIMIFSLFMIY